MITWFKNWLCGNEAARLRREVEAYRKMYENKHYEASSANHALESTLSVLGDYEKELAAFKRNQPPQNILDLAETKRTAYPIRNIVYKGYTIKLKNTIRKPEIKVQDFIQVLRSHHEWLENGGLTLQAYLKKYDGIDYGVVMNHLMFDIYRAYVPRKSYALDSDLYGISEQWSPTIDSWYLKKMDCENSSNELMSLFKAAGLTGPLEHFSWNSCGSTPLGGHSTVYCWDFSNEVWRHLETTVTSVSESEFTDLPENGDPNDQLGITDVWWSFNSQVARHMFATSAARKSYWKRERFQDFIIKKE